MRVVAAMFIRRTSLLLLLAYWEVCQRSRTAGLIVWQCAAGDAQTFKGTQRQRLRSEDNRFRDADAGPVYSTLSRGRDAQHGL